MKHTAGEITHPFEDRRDLYPDDTFLRKHGFQIHARPRAGEPVWRLGLALLPQSKALAITRAERKE